MSPDEVRDHFDQWEEELPELPPFIDEALKLEWEIYTYEKPAKEPVRVWLGRLGIMWGLIMASALIAVLAVVGIVSVVMALARYVGGLL